MMLYAAKCYWPGVTKPELERVAARAAREADKVSRSDKPVTHLGCLLFPDDELVLCLFESSSRGQVNQAAERAGMPCERLMKSIWLGFSHRRHNPVSGCSSGNGPELDKPNKPGSRLGTE
jgi:hypothetical protein